MKNDETRRCRLDAGDIAVCSRTRAGRRGISAAATMLPWTTAAIWATAACMAAQQWGANGRDGHGWHDRFPCRENMEKMAVTMPAMMEGHDALRRIRTLPSPAP